MASSIVKWPFALVGLLVIFVFQLGSTIKVNPDGGYEIVVALDQETPAPTNGANGYLYNMQLAFQAFSSRLWMATSQSFYLKSVSVVVPHHWNVSTAQSATDENYKTADIRLSEDFRSPRADNPNLCGQPGNFIELPSSFFISPQDSPYGLHWKALLHMWALYRFGVHPEHGYVGDIEFPYATKNARSQEWVVTGCSNEPILGKWKNITDPDDTASCENSDQLSEHCRFTPSESGQTASTSLLHFHWVESVTQFCDEDNHNIHAPNKQNELCNYKSVMQVIRESPDYLAVTEPRDNAPVTAIKFVQQSATPLFYLLLDRGLVQGNLSIANRIAPAIASTLFNYGTSKSTVAAVGGFPGNAGSPLEDLVPWSDLGTNKDAILDALGTLKNNGPLERDFSRALVAVANKIKALNHPNGAVVLVIKYGADTNNFDTYLPEAEVVHAFNEGNIIVNSIELNFPDHTGYAHLAKLGQETGGTYVSVGNSGELEGSIRNVISRVNKVLETSEITEDLKKHWKTLRNDVMTTTATIPVSSDMQGNLEIFISSTNPDLTTANFTASGADFFRKKAVVLQDLSFQLSRSLDWNEQGSKYTYKLRIPQSQLTGISRVNLFLQCRLSRCATNVLARTQVSGKSEVNIELSTSVENGVADLSTGRPISIFAKITKNGLPVQDAWVLATVTDTLSLSTSSVRLLDDGTLFPDVQKLDGVYSAYFVPETDGQFKVSVAVQGNPTRRRRRSIIANPHRNASSFSSRLLPIDQGDMGCQDGSCGAETIEDNFMEIVELGSHFRVEKAALYIPAPSKIRNLFTIDIPNVNTVDFFWETPRLPGRTSYTATSYDIRSAPSLELLINDFENQDNVPVPPNFRPLPPPNMEKITINRPTTTTYYAIRSEYRGKKSGISKLVVIQSEDEETPSTPETTTPEDNSTPSTPISSTEDGGESTTPDPGQTPSTPNPGDTTTTPVPGDDSTTATVPGDDSTTNTVPGDGSSTAQPPDDSSTPTEPETTTASAASPTAFITPIILAVIISLVCH